MDVFITLVFVYIVLAFLIFHLLKKMVFKRFDEQDKINRERTLIHQFNTSNPDFSELHQILNLNNIPIEE